MNRKIKALAKELEATRADSTAKLSALTAKLQVEYSKVFSASKEIAKAISGAERSDNYQFSEYGEIVSWTRFDGLSDLADCREYFETWLSENHCMDVDWSNDCLLYRHGDDNLIIQDDSRHRRDNGVWQNHKLIIPESEYLVEDDGHALVSYTVDVEKRNALIEKHMERTGVYPGVFRADYHGNVFPVNTQSKKEGAA